jgi:hypothetical protein
MEINPEKLRARITKIAEEWERKRLVDLALAAVHKDSEINRVDRLRIAALIKTLLLRSAGRERERPRQRQARWFKNPLNHITHIAGWKERAWRKRGKVKNNRVRVGGRLVPIHEEAARRAIAHYRRVRGLRANADGAVQRLTDNVLENLRKGRVLPPQ